MEQTLYSQVQQIEDNSSTVDELINNILGAQSQLNDLDNYLQEVRQKFVNELELLDADLDRIILQIPNYLYNLIVISQQLEMKKGLAKEQATYSKNEALLTATGTVQQKEAWAENQTSADRMIQLAYTTASNIVAKKIDGALDILDSAKKVQQRRAKEKVLTNAAGSTVGTF